MIVIPNLIGNLNALSSKIPACAGMTIYVNDDKASMRCGKK